MSTAPITVLPAAPFLGEGVAAADIAALADRAARTVHLVHHSLRRGGGLERYALSLAAQLRQMGCRVIFTARSADPELARPLGVDLRLLPVRAFPRKLRDYSFFRRVDRAGLGGRALQISLARVRVRDVIVCGGTHRGFLSRTGRWPGLFDALQIGMETAAYRSARLVVSHSDLCTRELNERYGVPLGRIRTLYPPVDQRFAAGSQRQSVVEARRRLGLPEDKVIFLFPSLSHHRKGLKPMLRALAGLSKSVILAVAGKPPGNCRQPFVRALGYVEDMATAYRAADFTILGSSYEPFGMVGPESLCCGTRLLFERHIGCLAALEPESALTFSANDPDSIRAAIEEAITLARRGEHRVGDPTKLFRYDPAPQAHVEALLQAAGFWPKVNKRSQSQSLTDQTSVAVASAGC